MSSYINGDLCLETVKRLIDYNLKCNFGFSAANDILQNDANCPKKCNLQTSYLYDNGNSLGKIDLTIGDKREVFNFCSGFYFKTNLKINCSSWNAKEYIIWDDADACFVKDAHCVRINNYCVCHCLPGYILMEEKCLKRNLQLNDSCELTEQCTQPFSVCLQGKCKCINGFSAYDTESCLQDNVPVGGFCSLHVQCNGSDNSGICEYGRCTCTEGFKLVEFACKKKNLELNDPCEFSEQCIQPFAVCFHGICKCMTGYSAFDTNNCYKDSVPVGGVCSLNKQCTGSQNSGICRHDRCICTEGFTNFDLACKKRNLQLNDSCELTAQCTQPLSVCFNGTCKCRNGYSTFDTDSCMKDTIPVGGLCNLSNQCTGSDNSGICENGRCTCAKEFTVTDLACEKSHPNSLGIESSNSQQHDTTIGVTLGTLFGGFILGVIVTAVVTTLMYRRFKLRTRKREEPDVMFAGNRTYGGASSAQISYRNDKKRDVAKLSPHSFAKETPEYDLSEKQENKRTDDVYNHLHEQTEQVDDTYDHACAVPNHCTGLSEYSNIHDAASFRPSPSKDGDDYSILRH
uniref:EB domain-containing protein n=1 Tax=Magallana gigas TaxID=29159 RepID=A0A8W8LYI1_MAGGI